MRHGRGHVAGSAQLHKIEVQRKKSATEILKHYGKHAEQALFHIEQ